MAGKTEKTADNIKMYLDMVNTHDKDEYYAEQAEMRRDSKTAIIKACNDVSIDKGVIVEIVAIFEKNIPQFLSWDECLAESETD